MFSSAFDTSSFHWSFMSIFVNSYFQRYYTWLFDSNIVFEIYKYIFVTVYLNRFIMYILLDEKFCWSCLYIFQTFITHCLCTKIFHTCLQICSCSETFESYVQLVYLGRYSKSLCQWNIDDSSPFKDISSNHNVNMWWHKLLLMQVLCIHNDSATFANIQLSVPFDVLIILLFQFLQEYG